MPLNSNTKIAFGWGAAIVFGLGSFYVSKLHIDKNRYEAMKARERIANATNDPTKIIRQIHGASELQK